MLIAEPNFQVGAETYAPKCTTILAQETECSARRLAELASDTKFRLRHSVENTYCVGLNLIEAKKLLGHGKFVSWLKTELNIDRKTAERFINVANMFQGKCDIMSHLEIAELDIAPTTLYEIAAPSTPTEAREEVLSRALQGEKITVSDAKKIIYQHKILGSEIPNLDDRTCRDKGGRRTTVSIAPTSVQSELEIGGEFHHLEERFCGGVTVRISSQSPIRQGEFGVVHDGPNPDLRFVTLSDGSKELIRTEYLEFNFPHESVHTPKTFTLAECRAEIARAVEEALIGRKTELEEAVSQEWEERLSASRQLVNSLKEEKIRLQQQVDELQALRKMESENQKLSDRIHDLEQALLNSTAQEWGQTFNKAAEKALNRDVKAALDKLEPDLHLRLLAESPPPDEKLPEVLNLVERAISQIMPKAIREYKEAIETASYWQQFEPIAQKWISLKTVIWAELSQPEKSKIRQLKESCPTSAFKIGDRVIYRGSCYDAQSGCVGFVTGTVFNDFKIRWERDDSTEFESRHSADELELIKQAA